ncbi:MAG: PqqD family protein [Anaerolineae bacterium]
MDAASFRPRLDAFVEADRRNGRHLLLHAHAPRWVIVNTLGREVAHLCDGTRTVQEIAAGIARRWSQPFRQVEADVAACVAQFAEAGFLPLQSMNTDRRPPTVDRRRVFTEGN